MALMVISMITKKEIRKDIKKDATLEEASFLLHNCTEVVEHISLERINRIGLLLHAIIQTRKLDEVDINFLQDGIEELGTLFYYDEDDLEYRLTEDGRKLGIVNGRIGMVKTIIKVCVLDSH